MNVLKLTLGENVQCQRGRVAALAVARQRVVHKIFHLPLIAAVDVLLDVYKRQMS